MVGDLLGQGHHIGAFLAVQGEQGFARTDRVIEFLEKADADHGVDGIFLAGPAGAHGHGDFAEGPAVDAGDVAFIGADRRKDLGRLGEGPLADPRRAAALGLDKFPELGQSFAGSDEVADHGPPLPFVLGFAADDEHLGANGFDDFHEASAALARQGFDGFIHFQAVADGRPQRRFHGGDDSPRRPAGQVADTDHGPGQFPRPFFGLHEGAVTVFDVEDDGVGTGSDFLAHDRAGNEGDALNGRRRVAQGIEQFIRRRDFAGLGDEGQADAAHLFQELRFRQDDMETGDGFQFICRTAGKSQAAAAHLGHGNAGGCD